MKVYELMSLCLTLMLSIKPKWCELIASGRKTIEVRKTRPKLETPFKCYIYCTKDKGISFWTGNLFDVCGNGKVIGEFVCDYILEITPDTYGHHKYFISYEDLNASCLTTNDLWKYGRGKTLYGWHISDLVIYDEPRELSDFSSGSSRLTFAETKDGLLWKWSGMMRPPQSWCYVERG